MRFQAGCPKPKEVASKAELDAQAACMQKEAQEVDDSDLGLLMRRHLKAPVPPLPAGQTCAAFRQVDLSQLSEKTRTCLAHVGDAKWTAEGLVDAASNASTNGAAASCNRRWLGTAETRCLLSNKDLVFFGNSVVRRQMYTVLDLLAGPNAHRQLTNFTDVLLPHPDSHSVARSWIWDQDNMTRGYHASQLFTVDLATGEHRFSMPHAAFCGLQQSHSVFNPGRLHQWREPGGGGGSEELTRSWATSKWAGREWKPLVSLKVHFSADGAGNGGGGGRRGGGLDSGETCAPRALSWAGSHPDGVSYVPPNGGSIKGASAMATTAAGMMRRRGRRRNGGGAGGEDGGLAARLRAKLMRDLQTFFSSPAGAKAGGEGGGDVREWIHNVSVHVEEVDAPSPRAGGGGGGLRSRRAANRAAPNVWLYFPTYHGERERFNGFCEDKTCECTNELAECAKRKHPECSKPPRHLCKPMAAGSAVFVEKARAFAAMLMAKGRLLGYPTSAVKLTPFYDDCWANRGRCQGARPCREPVDQAWTCRATSMLCVGRTWKDALSEAKAWIPNGHPSMSMLYLYDGQTSELLDETFRTWGPQTVGYGADAVIFGPQFGSFHGATAWRATLEVCGKRCDRRMRAWEGGRFSSLDRRYALERGSVTSPSYLFSHISSPLHYRHSTLTRSTHRASRPRLAGICARSSRRRACSTLTTTHQHTMPSSKALPMRSNSPRIAPSITSTRGGT